MAPFKQNRIQRMSVVYPEGLDRAISTARYYPIASDYATAIAPGMIVGLSSGNLVIPAAGGDVLGMVFDPKDPSFFPFRDIVRPASTAGYAAVLPFNSGIALQLWEDGDGGVIADWAATPYVNINNSFTAETGQTMAKLNQPTFSIDSSTANSETTTRTYQIVAQVMTPSAFNTNAAVTTLYGFYQIVPIAARIQTP